MSFNFIWYHITDVDGHSSVDTTGKPSIGDCADDNRCK